MRKNLMLTFENVELSNYQCFYDGSQVFRKPEKMIEKYSVVGKNGDLIISQDRYSNIVIPFDCHIRENFNENYHALINYLSSVEGYGRLETTEELDIYRLATFYGSIEPEMWQRNERGTFTLEFDCKPQKYLKSGEYPININGSQVVFNPTKMIAKPLIAVTGTGKITINDTVLTLSTNTGTTYIDCDIQDAYEGTINRNGNLTLSNGFPTLKAGSNTVSVSGCSILLYPRWWRI